MKRRDTRAVGGAFGGFRAPGFALAIAYLGICLASLALALLVAPAAGSIWETAAAAMALVATPAIVVQFFTSGRFEAISGRLGIDRIMSFHKVAAWWILLAVLLHPFFYIVPTVLDDPQLGTERLVAYVLSPRFASGAIAWLCLVVLVIIAALREWLPVKYEIWRASHVLLAIAAIAGTLHHAVSVGRYSVEGPVAWYWFAAALAAAIAVGTLYGLRWYLLRRREWRLNSVTGIADRTWELDIQPSAGTPPFDYEAGQFVWMSEGRRRFPLFDHPFSIADSPLRPGLSLIVKEAGDFTNNIGSLALGTPIGIDGPYGRFVLSERDCNAVLLIAGGAGIGPIMGLLRDLATRRDKRPIRLAYAAGAPEKFACLEEIDGLKADLDLQVLLMSEKGASDWTGAVGMLDRTYLGDLLKGLEPSQTVAMICGPGGMVTTLSDALLDEGLPMENIVYERFDYAAGVASRQDRHHARHFTLIGALLALGVALFTFS